MPEPRDIVVDGAGQQTAAYQLPASVYQYVQAVFVDVDTTGAGGPVEPVLSITNGSGVVIAKQRQGEPIDVGIQGSATWAQGLPRPSGGGSGAIKSGFYTLGPTVVASLNTVPLVFTFGFGDALLDLTVTNTPTIIAAGTYILRATVFRSLLAGFANKVELCRIAMNANYGTAETVAGSTAPMDAFTTNPVLSPSMPWVATAGQLFQVAADHNAGVNQTYLGAFNIVKIA